MLVVNIIAATIILIIAAKGHASKLLGASIGGFIAMFILQNYPAVVTLCVVDLVLVCMAAYQSTRRPLLSGRTSEQTPPQWRCGTVVPEAPVNLQVRLTEEMTPDESEIHLDIAAAPHLLVAGATGSGKSVAVNHILRQLLKQNSPSNLKLYILDPKRVEYQEYAHDPHLLCPIFTSDFESAIRSLLKMIDARYTLLEARGLRKCPDELEHLLVIVDELAMLSKPAIELLTKAAAIGRAAGVHLILATQHPVASILSGAMKANIPTRLALPVTSGTASRVILDRLGAEKLKSAGEFILVGSPSERLAVLRGRIPYEH